MEILREVTSVHLQLYGKSISHHLGDTIYGVEGYSKLDMRASSRERKSIWRIGSTY